MEFDSKSLLMLKHSNMFRGYVCAPSRTSVATKLHLRLDGDPGNRWTLYL